jgi:folate-dependent tRNA-U54 methylase TrmFO/GidA
MAGRGDGRAASCCTRCAPVRGTDAHQTDRLAELVCSNSFRSDDAETNAVGLLHEEMRRAAR